VIQFRKSSTWSGDQDVSPLLLGGIAPLLTAFRTYCAFAGSRMKPKSSRRIPKFF
jgi:hypothetical protein